MKNKKKQKKKEEEKKKENGTTQRKVSKNEDGTDIGNLSSRIVTHQSLAELKIKKRKAWLTRRLVF